MDDKFINNNETKLDISLIFQYLEYTSMSINLGNKWKVSVYLQLI